MNEPHILTASLGIRRHNQQVYQDMCKGIRTFRFGLEIQYIEEWRRGDSKRAA